MSSDAALLEKARSGDPAAVDELLRLHERSIYRFGLRMCGDEESAREVLQNTLLAAFKNLSGFRGDAALSTWLYQLARSFCVKQRRRGDGEPRTHEGSESVAARNVAAQTSPLDDRVHAQQMAEVIHAALLALPDEAREVLVLRDVEGLSADEAARVLQISVGALKSRLHRARTSLSASLAAVTQEPASVGCPQLATEMSAYAAGDVDQAMCERIEQHLARCERCAAACDALKRTVSLCRAIPGGDVPAPVKAAVRAALGKPRS